MSQARSPKAEQPSPEKKPDRKPAAHEDDIVGQAYDSRLMGRLIKYLRPYKWQAGISLAAIVLKALADILGPYLTKVAVDRYMTHDTANTTGGHSTWLARHLSNSPATGITQIALIYVGALCFSYVLEFAQTYLMQWTGQKIMYD